MTNQSAITDYLNKQYAYAEDNFDQLGDDAKRIAAIVIASNNIYNGGYGQFFFNTRDNPYIYHAAVSGLRELGLNSHAACLQSAYEIFAPCDGYLENVARRGWSEVEVLEKMWWKNSGPDAEIIASHLSGRIVSLLADEKATS